MKSEFKAGKAYGDNSGFDVLDVTFEDGLPVDTYIVEGEEDAGSGYELAELSDELKARYIKAYKDSLTKGKTGYFMVDSSKGFYDVKVEMCVIGDTVDIKVVDKPEGESTPEGEKIVDNILRDDISRGEYRFIDDAHLGGYVYNELQRNISEFEEKIDEYRTIQSMIKCKKIKVREDLPTDK